jgi:osmoprotectant transport system substrate-binding protein
VARRILFVLAAILLATTSCRVIPPAITVGSKDFAEAQLLGEMYAQVLEHAGLRVERKLNAGPTPVLHQALLDGEVDVYPEYTGTALLTVLKLPSDHDPIRVYETVAAEYRQRFGLEWLDPAPASNGQAIAMTKAEAGRLRIVTLSQFAQRARERAARGLPLALAGPPEFQEREDGLPGLRRVYGEFDVTYVPVASADRYLMLTRGDVDAVVAFETDGELSGFDLSVMIDERGLFPPYNVAPVVRASVARAYPRLAESLNALAPRLNARVLRALNFEITVRQRPPAEVAREFLLREGLIR